jgi:uncharacterized protein (TIGR02147 family)
MVAVFDFKSYKDFLTTLCHQERGLLSRLAEAAECQKSYLSACLNGKSQLTLDHALGIAEYLQFTDAEQDYLFVLVEKERATGIKLRRKLEVKLKDLSREAYKLKNQQNSSIVISGADSGLGNYYASWLPTALHTLTSIDRYQSLSQLSKRLQLTPEAAQFFINQLKELDLVKQVGTNYRWNSGNIHLADDSSWISTHHLNWRFRAIDNFQRRDPESTHYTAIQSMSESDFELLKKKIAHFIKDFNKVSDPSTPEEAFCFNIDFFKI